MNWNNLSENKSFFSQEIAFGQLILPKCPLGHWWLICFFVLSWVLLSYMKVREVFAIFHARKINHSAVSSLCKYSSPCYGANMLRGCQAQLCLALEGVWQPGAESWHSTIKVSLMPHMNSSSTCMWWDLIYCYWATVSTMYTPWNEEKNEWILVVLCPWVIFWKDISMAGLHDFLQWIIGT